MSNHVTVEKLFLTEKFKQLRDEAQKKKVYLGVEGNTVTTGNESRLSENSITWKYSGSEEDDKFIYEFTYHEIERRGQANQQSNM